MLKPQQFFPYQRKAIIHQITHNESMLWLDMGLGKEQPNSEPVLTPSGWVNMGDLKPGMFVIGSNGTPSEILSVHPQGVKDVLRITFNDGSWTRCGWDHIWMVQTATQKKREQGFQKMTTRELIDSGLRSGPNRKWSIPLISKPVSYIAVDLPVSPYLMGVILGDGNISEKSGVTVCTDVEIIRSHLGLNVTRKHETSGYTGYTYIPGVKQIMRELGLMGKLSHEKFVPEIYLRGSKRQRLLLLKGLLDTDGSPITCGGGVEFSSSSESLADSVVELTQSLGGVARKSDSRITRYQNGEGRSSWRVNVKLPSELEPFKLKRKLDKWIRPTKYQPVRYIESIEPEDYQEESTCISVGAADSLYVTRNHIVTHNTPITLTTIEHRIRMGEIKKCLIVGPVRVIIAVWEREARKWEHTKHLSFSVIRGTPEQRLRAMFREADIHLVNYENLAWLSNQLTHYYLNQNQEIPWQMCVYDEVSKMKNAQAQRMKGGVRTMNKGKPNETKTQFIGWKKIIPHFKYKTGLTGTPASNGYLDLHGQYLAIDGGERLGEFISHFRDRYFSADYMGFNHEVTDVGKVMIEDRIADITIKMDAEDYLDIPPVKFNDIWIQITDKVRSQYDDIEKDMFTRLDDGTEIEVFNRASVSNKCLQFCNGSAYNEPGQPEWSHVHDEKLDAVGDILEEAAGSPVLLGYTFRMDAERIMKKYKHYNPVNLTTTPTAQLPATLERWNQGKIRLMIGHPACLHPSTQVLTERCGWVKLMDVKLNDRVFDGVEFVEHDGCSYSGYKEVTDVFGITMTPDHKLFIGDEWVEARNVGDSEEVRTEALYQYEGDDPGVGEMFEMSDRVQNNSPECSETQSTESDPLSTLCSRSASQSHWNANLENLVRDEASIFESAGSKLRSSWNNNMRQMAGVPQLLRRHVRRLLGRLNTGANRCEQVILKRELHLGDSICTTRQQANESTLHLSGGRHSSSRTVSSFRLQQDDVDYAIEPGNDSRRSRTGCSKLTLREEYEAGECEAKGSQKEHVYDLVNCGPRHQFLIRNDEGEVFISHNSMGHGIDGLQDTGHILVWFGLPWSLEFYYQMIGRLKRTGQTKPVIVHQLLIEGTLDLAVLDALRRKATDEAGLKQSIDRYRQGQVTKELSFL